MSQYTALRQIQEIKDREARLEAERLAQGTLESGGSDYYRGRGRAQSMTDNIEMIDDDAWEYDTNELPAVSTAGAFPTAGEKAATWRAWNANRQKVRRLQRLSDQGFGQLPTLQPGGSREGMTRDQLIAARQREKQERDRSQLDEEIMRMERKQPSINTISSPGTY